MTADPFPEGTPRPAIVEFFRRYAATITAGDGPALRTFIASPFGLVSKNRTVFFESPQAASAEFRAMLAERRANGVVHWAVEVLAELPLPDEAARVKTRWTLSGADGAALVTFESTYTLVAEADLWMIVVNDIDGYADAAAAKGWPDALSARIADVDDGEDGAMKHLAPTAD